jgi:hypothetical protein
VSGATMTADVRDATEGLEIHFGDRVAWESDGEGGAVVTIEEIELGKAWTRTEAPLRFVAPYNFPAAPPYPYYLPRDAHPQGPWPTALQPIEWRGAPAIQVSLRNNRWDPARDSLLGCVLQVAAWLREQ